MPDDVQVVSQKHQYLIGKAKDIFQAGGEELNLSQLKQVLDKEPDTEIIKIISPRGRAGASTGAEIHPEAILVARMTEERAELLRQQAGGQLIVEPDYPLHYALDYALPFHSPYELVIRDPVVLTPNSIKFVVTITVKGDQNQPIGGARVYLYGSQWPVQGLTDENGQVKFTIYDETGEALRGLYIEPRADYWNVWIPGPFLETERNNVVTLRPLSQTFDKFPNQQHTGWGQQAMNLDRLPTTYTGKGAKVAFIDSGVATSHRDLEGQIRGGYDLVNQSDQTWNQDLELHGTHCIGIVAGKNDNYGIRGFAPEADVYAFKIFPGGRLGHLIEALERCIEMQVDVVNLSLGSEYRSRLVEQELQKAKAWGVACIAAAGNSAGSVEYPAASPNVLAVAAIGRKNTFPSYSYHSTQAFTGGTLTPFTPEGFFSAKFSCSGPEVGVCAPGVAILSSVPPDNFAVWDGTSLAASHITGLAALIVAHHPAFQSQGLYAQYNSLRVDGIFKIIQQSAHPLQLGDPGRVGAGLPDALIALNLSQVALGLSQGITTAAPGVAYGWPQLLSDLQKLLSSAGVQAWGGTPIDISQPLSEEEIDQSIQQLKGLILQAQLGPYAPPRETTIWPEPGIVSEDIDQELQSLALLIQQAGLKAA